MNNVVSIEQTRQRKVNQNEVSGLLDLTLVKLVSTKSIYPTEREIREREDRAKQYLLHNSIKRFFKWDAIVDIILSLLMSGSFIVLTFLWLFEII